MISFFRLAAVVAGLAPAVTQAAATSAPAAPGPTVLASFGSGLGSGSAVGPDGALYVTDGNAGALLRIDLTSGEVTTVADGLPVQVLGIGGAMDVTFIDDTVYVLVTMVGGDIVGGDHVGDDVVGIYRLEDDGSFMVTADLGEWSVNHPPGTDFFLTAGVQYALEPAGESLLVTDGHHNRVLEVGPDGTIVEVVTLDNVVPTGLERVGDTTYVALAGPLPHEPVDGRVAAFGPGSSEVVGLAAGASMVVDVELAGPQLYALSQGTWDGVQEGSPAEPDTGRLMRVGHDGTMTPVVDGYGDEIVLDRPTSLEFIDDTAYLVTLAGDVLVLDHVAG